MWGGLVPLGATAAWINGTKQKPAEVALTRGDALVNHLSIADGGNSVASLVLDGAALTVSGTVDVAKYTESEGRFVIRGGRVFASTIFVSGGGGPAMHGHGTVEIFGGSLVTKDIELGASSGSRCILHIIGSKCSGIAAEDGLHIGVYNYLSQEKEPPPSATELIFDLDADGVTPIFTWGKTEGRVNFPVPDGKGNGLGSCQLEINLLAPPPTGDILLIGCANSCRGTFSDLAEGSPVRAEFNGQTYDWKLTYQGGPTRHDIVLTDSRVVTADGKRTPYVDGEPAKAFRFDRTLVESAYRTFYRQSDSEQPPFGGATPAFPGAEGYGAYARGGRGGQVLFVTNLNDSGPGSLRAAIETKGPRTVIFRVGGLIETQGLEIREPYITFARPDRSGRWRFALSVSRVDRPR